MMLWALIVTVFGTATALPGSAPTNLDVLLSSYLGDGAGGEINVARGVDVDSGGNVYVVGTGPFNYGLRPLGDAAQSGFLLKLGANLRPSRIFRYGSEINKVIVRQSSDKQLIMLQSDIGVTVLDGTHFTELYSVARDCERLNCFADLGRDGTLAVVRRRTQSLELFNNGELTASATIGNNHLTELAVDGAHKRVIYAYYTQSSPHGTTINVPCIRALDYTLRNEIWHDYCVSGLDAYDTQNLANSVINHLYFSDVNDRLFISGYTDAGDSIFRYDPIEVAENHDSLHGLRPDMVDQPQQPGVDPYEQVWNMGNSHRISYVAKIDARTGSVSRSEFLVTRMGDGSGMGVSTNAVSGGKGGILVAAQTAMLGIENRNNLTVNGQATARFSGADGVLLVTSGDLVRRLVWHQFSATQGRTEGIDVGSNVYNGNTRVAFLLKTRGDNEVVQVHPISGTSHGANDNVEKYNLVVVDV